jgi:hypothetical protein
MNATDCARDCTGFSDSDLDQLERQLSRWRRHRRGRARLPEEVWLAAAALAQKHGVSGVARTLHLDFYKLRQRCEAVAPLAPAPTSPPQWVELQLESPTPRSYREVRVELADGGGARMTLELAHDVSALVALSQAFWNRHP